MKTQRRHDLETNVLADWLGHQLRRAKPYANAALIGVFALMAVVVGWMIWSKQSAKRASEGWNEYVVATDTLSFGMVDPDQLKKIAREYPDTKVGEWSQLLAADELLRTGSRQIFQDKAAGFKSLNDAADAYKRLQKTATLDAVRGLAGFGLAQAYEMLGNLDQAIEAYGQVEGALAKVAADRAENLKKDERIGAFYDWFVAASLPDRTFAPGTGTPGRKPEFDLGTPGDLEREFKDSFKHFEKSGDNEDRYGESKGKESEKSGEPEKSGDSEEKSPLDGLLPSVDSKPTDDENAFPDSVVPPDPLPPSVP